MNEAVQISKDDAAAALREAAFTNEEDGRTTVHSFLSFVGADHDLDHALQLVADAKDIAWVPNLLRHDLAVQTEDGRIFRYDVQRPS